MARAFFNSAPQNTFLPFIKYDARGGHVFRADKNIDGSADNVNITRAFKAVFDIDNFEHGFIEFSEAGVAPRFALAHNSQPEPSKPEGKFKKGIRVRLRLNKDCGGDVREFSSAAQSVVEAFGKLVDDYDTGVVDNVGKLPVVVLGEPVQITSNIKQPSGATMKATNYAPTFQIVGWVTRPEDLPQVAIAAPAAAPVAASSPPSTGSTRAAPPVAPAPAPAKAAVDEDDFG